MLMINKQPRLIGNRVQEYDSQATMDQKRIYTTSGPFHRILNVKDRERQGSITILIVWKRAEWYDFARLAPLVFAPTICHAL